MIDGSTNATTKNAIQGLAVSQSTPGIAGPHASEHGEQPGKNAPSPSSLQCEHMSALTQQQTPAAGQATNASSSPGQSLGEGS